MHGRKGLFRIYAYGTKASPTRYSGQGPSLVNEVGTENAAKYPSSGGCEVVKGMKSGNPWYEPWKEDWVGNSALRAGISSPREKLKDY